MSIVRNTKEKGKKSSAISQWWAGGIVIILTLMLCLTINYRAFSELNKESTENLELEQKIQSVTTNNLLLQEQIHYLKNDPKTVEREVRKFGLRRPKEKVSVSTNK